MLKTFTGNNPGRILLRRGCRRSAAKAPKGFEAREGRRRRWLPEPPRKPKGSEAREARPTAKRSVAGRACGATEADRRAAEVRGETKAEPQAKHAGSPRSGARPPGLAKPRNKTRRGPWRRPGEDAGLWSDS